MNFGQALELVKSGGKARRSHPAWRGGEYICLGYGAVCLCIAEGMCQPEWPPRQADMLAEDWEAV